MHLMLLTIMAIAGALTLSGLMALEFYKEEE